MKQYLDANQLYKALSKLSTAAGDSMLGGGRGTPHVSVKQEKGQLKLETFSSVSGAQVTLETPHITEGDGETRIYPLVEMRELVRRLGGKMEFMVDKKGHLLLSSGGSRYKIKSVIPDAPLEFPFGEEESEESFEVDGPVLFKALQEVLVVAKSPSGRSYSGGTLFDFRGKLRLVNTDGFRMAVISLENPSGIQRRIQVDTEAIKNFAKALGNEEGIVEGEIHDHYILFVKDSMRFSVTTLTVSYPDYEKILDRKQPGEIHFDKEEMQGALERLLQFGKYQEQSNAIQFHFENGEVLLTIEETPKGKGEETLTFPVETEEDAFSVSLNGGFLLDFLRVANANKIILLHDTPQAACLFYPEGNEDFSYYLMTLKHPGIRS
ncbi:hypothetical protein H8D30_06410 [bacterium]|nr:hypothetical protein [bacterium]